MSSEETMSNNSVVIGQSAVSLSTDDYRKLLATIFSQNQKIQALKNLHHLIQSKDGELKSANEKVQNLQLALDRAETRLVNQIRLAATSKAPPPRRSTLEADSAAYCDEVRRVAPVMSRPIKDNVDPVWRGSEIPTHDVRSEEHSGSFVRTSSPLSEFDSSVYSGKDAAVQSVPLKTFSTQCVGGNGGIQTSLDVGRNASLPGRTAVKSFGAGEGVSKDLLDKLMHQNARLRKVVKDILEQRGTTLESHLDKQESQDVVSQLREELRLSKQQNEKLKQIISAKDTDDVLRKYSEQSESLQKAKKTVATLQAMVDAYGKEYEKLQQENKTLKEQLTSGEHFKELQETLARYKEEASKAEQLKERCEMLESSKQLLESQIAVFQEDFAIEHEEFLKKDQQNSATIAKHQDMIRHLAAEVQKNRISLEEETKKRKCAESAWQDLEKRFREFISVSRSDPSSSACRNVETSSVVPPRRCLDLQVDNPVEAPSPRGELRRDQSLLLPQRSFSDGSSDEVALVCPRCEREFERNDEDRFREHTARCTDD